MANNGQLSSGSALGFTVPRSGDPGVLVRLRNGSVVAYDAVCTHQGCTVEFDTGSSLLFCPCHGAIFDPANHAAVLGGPTRQPLAQVRVVVDQASGDIRLSS